MTPASIKQTRGVPGGASTTTRIQQKPDAQQLAHAPGLGVAAPRSMGRVAVHRLARGDSPARVRKALAVRFPTWAHHIAELVDAVVEAAR